MSRGYSPWKRVRMMKNDTRSSRLILIDNSGDEIPTRMQLKDTEPVIDPSVTENSQTNNVANDLMHNKSLFIVVSIACAAAAIAAGSYAIWLSKHKETREALSSVNDLLHTCQDRMSQIEQDLKSLSNVSEAG